MLSLGSAAPEQSLTLHESHGGPGLWTTTQLTLLLYGVKGGTTDRQPMADTGVALHRGLRDVPVPMLSVKGMYPAPHIHERFTIHKWLRQTAYILTHNFNNLEHIANNCMSALTHTDVTIAHH